MIFIRSLEKNIEKWFFRKKIIIVYGPRQVGKTTLVKSILHKYANEKNYYNCEIIGIRQAFQKQDPLEIKKIIGKEKLIVLDEAQKIPHIGLVLKLFIDTYPETQIIATGSSSFDLSNKINEPLTGRALEFILYPLSILELAQHYKRFEITGQFENLLRFGSYPEIINSGLKDAQILLDNLTGKYLYQDALEFEHLKKSDLLVHLLQLLALQLGNEVSTHELANTLSCNRKTVIRYLELLEKSFVIFRLPALSRNLRKEIAKKQKIYFYDLGVRNSLIARYNTLHVRNDIGALWENFCIIERLKYLQYNNIHCNRYFWRTHDQKEIDYIEEYNDKFEGFEFKWNKNTFNKPRDFTNTYKNARVHLVNKDNCLDFFGI